MPEGHAISVRDVKTAAQLIAEDANVDLREHFLKGGQFRTAGKRRITAKSANQRRYLDAIEQHDIVFGIGPAGTGKTYLAMAQAVTYLLAKKVSRIILARPAVEAGEKLGFLPGDLQEKVNPYLRPLYDALYDMLDIEKAERMLERGTIEVAPHRLHARPHAERRVRHPRRSAEHHDRADEDVPHAPRASDRRPWSPATSRRSTCRRAHVGPVEAMTSSGRIEGIAFVCFDERDVVRHKLVQAIVKAYEAMADDPVFTLTCWPMPRRRSVLASRGSRWRLGPGWRRCPGRARAAK